MNETFNFSRWLGLLKLQAMTNGRKQLLCILAIFGLTFLPLAWLMVDGRLGHATTFSTSIKEAGLFLFLWFIFMFASCIIAVMGCTQAARAFKAYNRRESGWMAMLLPASRLEKYTLIYFWSVVLIPLAYCLTFVLSLLASYGLGVLIHSQYLATIGTYYHEIVRQLDELMANFSVNLGPLSDVNWWGYVTALFVAYSWATLNVIFACSAKFSKFPLLISVVVLCLINTFHSIAFAFLAKDTPSNSTDLSLLTEVLTEALNESLIFQGFVGLVALIIGYLCYKRRTLE